jgi:hypothetical protein
MGSMLGSPLTKGIMGGIAGAGLMRMLGGGGHHHYGDGPVFGGMGAMDEMYEAGYEEGLEDAYGGDFGGDFGE